jgi:pimeloyl-ACP methyl ester carboxylesterase
MAQPTHIDTTQARHFVTANGERLAFITAGNPANPPVLLVHGWTSFMGVWENTLPLLAKTHYVVALDLLGHGMSAKPHNGDYSITAQGRRVLALADMLGLTQFTLVGHSMGGQIALGIAGKFAPERVTRLVAISPAVSSKLTPGSHVIHQLYRFGRFFHFAAPLVALARHNPRTAQALYGRLWFYNLRSLPNSSLSISGRIA